MPSQRSISYFHLVFIHEAKKKKVILIYIIFSQVETFIFAWEPFLWNFASKISFCNGIKAVELIKFFIVHVYLL